MRQLSVGLYPSMPVSLDDRRLYLPVETHLLVLQRDRPSGALRVDRRPGSCVVSEGRATRAPAGCTRVPILWGDTPYITLAADGRTGVLNHSDVQTLDLGPPIKPQACLGVSPPGVAKRWPCPAVRGFVDTFKIAVDSPAAALSADALNLYVAQEGYTQIGDPVTGGDRENVPGVVAVFRRDPGGGGLQQLPGPSGCLGGGGGAGCTTVRALHDPAGLLIAPDGRFVHVLSSAFNDESLNAYPILLTFARAPASGELRQLRGRDGCLSAWPRDHGCRRLRGAVNMLSAELSPDGRHIYLAGGEPRAATVLRIDRDPITGRLVQPPRTSSCVSAGSGPLCRRVTGLAGTMGSSTPISIAPDGRSVYLGLQDVKGVAALSRDPNSGRLGNGRCVSSSRSRRCGRADGLRVPQVLTPSLDGRHLYVLSESDGAAWLAVLHVTRD